MYSTTNSDILKRNMVLALEKSLGIVTTACESNNLARQTHYRWLKEDEDYRNKVDEIGDIALDFVESQLHKQIEGGEVSSTIFYLKCKGKKRGYVERTELEHTGSIITTVQPQVIASNYSPSSMEKDVDLN